MPRKRPSRAKRIASAYSEVANRFLPDIAAAVTKRGKEVIEASAPRASSTAWRTASRLGRVSRAARGPVPFIAAELANPSTANAGEGEWVKKRDIAYKQRQVRVKQDQRRAREAARKRGTR